MSDDPRGPFDQQPDDPTAPVPVAAPSDPTSVLPATSAAQQSGPVAWVKSAPLWAKIAVPVAAVFLIAGIAGASGNSNKKSAGTVATAPSTTARSTTTTEAATTTEPSTVATTLAPTTAPRVTAPPVTQPPATSPTTHPAPPPTQGGPANPGDSKNCSDFATYAQAKAWFDTYYPRYGDVAHLDRDGDGIPCETLPGAP